MTTTDPPPPSPPRRGGGNAATQHGPETVFSVPGTHTIMTTSKQCPNTHGAEVPRELTRPGKCRTMIGNRIRDQLWVHKTKTVRLTRLRLVGGLPPAGRRP